MNYSKLDAALMEVLSEQPLTDAPYLEVSVRTLQPPDMDEQRELQQLGVRDVSAKGRVFSARLSPQAVSELSEKNYVRLVSLAQTLRPAKS